MNSQALSHRDFFKYEVKFAFPYNLLNKFQYFNILALEDVAFICTYLPKFFIYGLSKMSFICIIQCSPSSCWCLNQAHFRNSENEKLRQI